MRINGVFEMLDSIEDRLYFCVHIYLEGRMVSIADGKMPSLRYPPKFRRMSLRSTV